MDSKQIEKMFQQHTGNSVRFHQQSGNWIVSVWSETEKIWFEREIRNKMIYMRNWLIERNLIAE